MFQKLKIIAVLFIISLFLFLRFYNIRQGLFFFNDMGRDLSVLQLWQNTHKFPLLGPQTSALPINQSAFYFYLLYPLFLVFGGHPLSSLVTLSIVYLSTFILSLYIFRKDSFLTKIIIVTFFLISIHYQYITQSRFVWNPSFVTPFIIVAIISFYLIQNKFSQSRLLAFTFSIAFAVSLSFSIVPLLFSFLVYWLIFSRRHFLPLLKWLSISFAMFNFPTIMFEFRHRFQLTKAIFTQQSPVQQGLTFSTKTHNLAEFIFATTYPQLNLILFFSLLALCLFILYKYRKNITSLQFICSSLYLLVTISSYLTPVSIQPHYIFAYTSLLFIIIACQSRAIIIISLIFLSYSYLNLYMLNTYFKPAPRSYDQLVSCFQKYCHQYKAPTYVSVQSNFHPFHNGPEHRYLMSKAGCNVKSIETENGSAQNMAVIVDSGSFDSRTNYYELELFGKYQFRSELDCLPNFKIKTLEKI